MVVSLTCNINATNALNQPNAEQSIHWRQTSQSTSPETDQQNCILNFTTRDQRPSSPVQDGEENSCFSSENGANNLSPPQETSRSSGSEDLGVKLFPISGCNTTQRCFDYSNSDNESSQLSPSSSHDDDSFRSGKGSGHGNGKPKVHKCRSCGFSTTNKNESYEHIATHMKPEKILRCPNCPFVTEYKHHLDFHIWNHQGVKPFKCEQCAYHCVNKSMLKSHLKSHSNVYQYSCVDCNYRTKYCHSLKIHLRKYNHSPGMVLDPEGNPNPNPVIDVYGNRRGPKQKSKKSAPGNGLARVSPMPQPSIPPLNSATFQTLKWNVFFPDAPHIQCPIIPNTGIMTASPLVNEGPKHETASQESDTLNNNNNNTQVVINSNNNTINNSCSSFGGLSYNNNNLLMANNNDTFAAEVVHMVKKEPTEMEQCMEEVPLNLSVSHGLASSSQERQSAPGSAKASRRKGVACKLKRILVEQEDGAKDLSVPAVERVITPPNISGELPLSCEMDDEMMGKIGRPNYFYCHFCDITFHDHIMFTMHMGLHGFSDPFQCNRCGMKTENKIDFYAHMISYAH